MATVWSFTQFCIFNACRHSKRQVYRPVCSFWCHTIRLLQNS